MICFTYHWSLHIGPHRLAISGRNTDRNIIMDGSTSKHIALLLLKPSSNNLFIYQITYSPSVFNISLGTLRMLMNGKSRLIPITYMR